MFEDITRCYSMGSNKIQGCQVGQRAIALGRGRLARRGIFQFYCGPWVSTIKCVILGRLVVILIFAVKMGRLFNTIRAPISSFHFLHISVPCSKYSPRPPFPSKPDIAYIQ